jgi:hypothetical protein
MIAFQEAQCGRRGGDGSQSLSNVDSMANATGVAIDPFSAIGTEENYCAEYFRG